MGTNAAILAMGYLVEMCVPLRTISVAIQAHRRCVRSQIPAVEITVVQLPNSVAKQMMCVVILGNSVAQERLAQNVVLQVQNVVEVTAA